MADGTQIRITAVDATTAAFRSVQSNIAGLQGMLRGIAGPLAAAFSVAGIAAFAKSVVDVADKLNDVAEKTGFTVEQLSALGNAAKLNGSDAETLNSSLVKLNKAISEAGNGSEEQRQAFERLGITQDQLRSKAPIEIFYKIADAFAGAENGAAKTELAMKLLGRSGADLIPVLNQGSDALKGFGASITTEQAKQIGEFNDNIDKLVINLTKAAATILGPLAKGINSIFASLEAGNKRLRADTEGLASTFDNFLDGFGIDVENIVKDYALLQEQLNKPLPKPKVSLAPEETKEEADRRISQYAERNKMLADVFKSLETPVDTLNKKLQDYQNLLDEGLITQSQFTDLVFNAQNAFQDLQPKIEINDTALKKYSATVKNVQDSLQSAAVNGLRSLEDALVGVYSGTLTVKEAFRNMAVSIIQDLIRIQIQRSITGPLSDALSGLFTASNGPVQLAGPRALGGTAQMGEAYMVGEKGPELFIPGKTGVVVPNNELGGSGAVVNQTINISAGVSQTVRAEVMGMLPRIMEATKAAVADSKRRGGTFGKMMA